MRRSSDTITHEFCQQVRRDGGYMALTYLKSVLKEGKCIDCPSKGSTACQDHVQNLIHKILPSPSGSNND